MSSVIVVNLKVMLWFYSNLLYMFDLTGHLTLRFIEQNFVLVDDRNFEWRISRHVMLNEKDPCKFFCPRNISKMLVLVFTKIQYIFSSNIH